MGGTISSLASHLPLLAGFFFVLCAVGIVLRRASTKWIDESHVLKIIEELKENWRTKGYVRMIATWVIFTITLLVFLTVPFQHKIIPSPTVIAHWWFFPHVPELMPDNEYIVLHMDKVDPLYGTRSRYVFCAQGQVVPMDEGEMLRDIVYKEHGDCKELLHYNFELDEHLKVKMYAKE